MTYQYKVMCGFVCCISAKIMHSSLLTWRGCCLNYLKDRSCNAQNRISGEISCCIFETNNNAVRPNGCHIYNTDEDIDMKKTFLVCLNIMV